MSLKLNSPLRLLLIDGKIDEFNQQTAEEPADLKDVDLRAVDLRGANLSHANLQGAYLRNCDLRGLDLYYADLDGASIHDARISGTRFPQKISAGEISLSHNLGVRMRVTRG